MKPSRRVMLCALAVTGLILLAACSGSETANEIADSLPTVQPAGSPELEATTAPADTREPTKVPTVEPSNTPLPKPTETPSLEPTETPQPKATETPTPSPAPTLGTETGDRPDGTVEVKTGSFACMGTSGQGVTCLTEEGEWQNFTHGTSHLGADFINDIDACSNGDLLIMHGSGVSIYDGQSWREVPSGWGFGSPSAIACAAEDEFWVAHFEGVSHFDGSEWENFDAAGLAFAEEATDLVEDVAVDDEGNIWVVTANSIARYDGKEWQVYQVGQGISEKYFYDAIAIDETGRPWAAHSDGLLALGDGDWDLFQNRNIYALQDVAIDHQGNKWVATFSQGIAVFDGAAWQIRDRFSQDLLSNQVNKIAVDEIGRIWVATEWGLHIFDGQEWHVYRMDNSDLTDNSIRTLDIVGNPPLPAPLEKQTGSLGGSIAAAGGPHANAAIEICVEPLGTFFEGETPCSSQPWVRSAVTDQAGGFSFHDLPAGYYVIGVETEDGWAQLTSEYGIGSERVLVTSGETNDVGELTLNVEE